MSADYNHELRARALAMPETDLRRAVDRLLEQCGREDTAPAGVPNRAMVHTTEVYAALGLRGPDYSALARAVEAGQRPSPCAHCGGAIDPSGLGHDWIGPVPVPGEPQRRYHLSPDFPDCRRASGACGTDDGKEGGGK